MATAACEPTAGLTSSSSADEETCGFDWPKLWSLPLRNKVLHFIWRLCTDSLPLCMKLQHKGMHVETRCPVCFRFDEDGGRCFIKCKKVKDVRRKPQLEHVRLQILPCADALSCMEQILNLNEEGKLKSCLLLWQWWHERNRANAGDAIKFSDEICHSIDYLCMHLFKVQQSGKVQKQQQKERWSRPPLGTLKINADGAFLKETNT